MRRRHLFLVSHLLLVALTTWPSLASVDLDQHLETSHQELTSSHFNLRFPKDVSPVHAQHIVDTLESEFERLAAWIPLPPGRRQRLEIVLFHAEDFERAYGPAIIGLYDGKIRIPLSEWNGRSGVLTSTLTHELVHALITISTDYGAPNWLHEGLAQYLENDHSFPDPALRSKSERLSFVWLDEVLNSATDAELLDQAYRESVWVVHFLGQTYGISGFRRLLRTYAETRDTDVVVEKALQTSKAALEQSFQAWNNIESPRTFRKSRSMQRAPTGPEEILGLHGVSRRQAVRHNRRMNAWHQGYEKRIEPFKASLRRVVEALRQDPDGPPIDGCRRMNRDLAALVAGMRDHACPHPDIHHVLLDAFHSFEELGVSCRLGRTDRMWNQLNAAEESLRISASLLASYGLEP